MTILTENHRLRSSWMVATVSLQHNCLYWPWCHLTWLLIGCSARSLSHTHTHLHKPQHTPTHTQPGLEDRWVQAKELFMVERASRNGQKERKRERERATSSLGLSVCLVVCVFPVERDLIFNQCYCSPHTDMGTQYVITAATHTLNRCVC